MKCGNHVSTTPFCPQCGKKNESALVALLSHVSQQVITLRKRQETIERRRTRVPGYEHLFCSESFMRRLAKWESWRDELKKVIGEQLRDE